MGEPRKDVMADSEYAPSRWATPITQHFINGEFVDSINGATFETIDPTNEKVIATLQAADSQDVDAAVEAAHQAFDPAGPWRTMVGGDRRDLLLKLASLIETHRKE